MLSNGHSEYPPSALKRLMNCPASKALCDSMPDMPTSAYALQGSAAHLLASRCLELEIDATDKIGSPLEYVDTRVWTVEDVARYTNAGLPVPNYAMNEPYTFAAWYGQVDQDMALAVQKYLDEIRRKRALLKAHKWYIEHQFDLSWIIKGMFGTVDSALLAPFNVLYVDDYKHGAGVAVDVKENSQLMAYGLGALGKDNPYGVSTVVLTIIQPRAVHADGPIRSWEISAKELLEWGMDVLRPALIKTNNVDACFKAGDWCKWCNGASRCPLLANQMFSSQLTPIESKLPAINDLTSDELDRYLSFADLLEIWIANIRQEGYRRLELALPNAPKQFKLVAGKGSRQWHNEEFITQFAQQRLGKNAFVTPGIKSPAQMEKAFELAKFNPKELALFINKIEGRSRMVPIEDHQKPVLSKVEQMFGKGE